ncbi:MAG: hypothetical protein EOP43_07685 [Sphingobacteriaceae bacterium]|nr:MAG: hypothetical protein EOP43_07685 [Sphingobacteriaceae bacterium]
MEATFKIKVNEFDIALFEQIQNWIKSNDQSEITISIKSGSSNDSGLLNKSIQEISEGKSKSFSMDELKLYLESNFK